MGSQPETGNQKTRKAGKTARDWEPGKTEKEPETENQNKEGKK